jgi:flagellin
MAIYVNTNVQSVFAQRALGGNTFDLQKSIEKLSTGFRINRASDDAAGLSISEKLTSQIRGLEKAEQNIGDGISMVQTAEGALSIVQDNLQRIRELTVQAYNGTNSNNELDAIQREINARVTTITDIAGATEFNGLNLLDASLGGGTAALVTAPGATQDFTLQTGADQGQQTFINFDVIDVDVASTAAGTLGENSAVNLDDFHIGGSTGAAAIATNGGFAGGARNGDLDDLDAFLDNVSRMRSELGAIQNSLESKAEYLNVARENALSSRSRIKDVDVAKESSMMVKSQILQQTSAAMLSQANQTPQLALNLLP